MTEARPIPYKLVTFKLNKEVVKWEKMTPGEFKSGCHLQKEKHLLCRCFSFGSLGLLKCPAEVNPAWPAAIRWRGAARPPRLERPRLRLASGGRGMLGAAIRLHGKSQSGWKRRPGRRGSKAKMRGIFPETA